MRVDVEVERRVRLEPIAGALALGEGGAPFDDLAGRDAFAAIAEELSGGVGAAASDAAAARVAAAPAKAFVIRIPASSGRAGYR